MIKAILFDADGVILVGKKFSEYLKNNFGISEKDRSSFFDGRFKIALVGKQDLKEIIYPYLKDWGWDRSVDDFLDLWFKSEHIIDMRLIDYIQKIRKKGIRCYLATNQENHRIKYMKEEMEFDKLFDKVYSSSHVGYMKPDLKFFEKILGDLKNLQRKEILFWDDSLKHVEAAKKIGINAELYTSFENCLSKMATYLN